MGKKVQELLYTPPAPGVGWICRRLFSLSCHAVMLLMYVSWLGPHGLDTDSCHGTITTVVVRNAV